MSSRPNAAKTSVAYHTGCAYCALIEDVPGAVSEALESIRRVACVECGGRGWRMALDTSGIRFLDRCDRCAGTGKRDE